MQMSYYARAMRKETTAYSDYMKKCGYDELERYLARLETKTSPR